MQLPDGFLRQFNSLGVDALSNLDVGLSEPSPVSIRLNPGKASGDGAALFEAAEPVVWCAATGRYLQERPAFTFDPAMHQGRYYVQDASSMFISHVINFLTADGAPVRYLDACAAPGGKTTAAIDALPRGSVVVANEYVGSRAAILRENLTKWGAPLCVVTQGDTAQFATLGPTFDIIAADVPCSGEGMMRKDPRAVEQWSPALVSQCVERQREIVTNLWTALRPGGYMIYSTCTFNLDENERMLDYMRQSFGAESVEVPIDEQWGIIPAVGGSMAAYRFIPGAIRGEGLFMAVVRKPDEALANEAGRKIGRKKEKLSKKSGGKVPDEMKCWLAVDESVAFSLNEAGTISASIATQWSDFPFTPTLEIATLKGRDVVASHALAMSQKFNRQAFPEVELDRAAAIDYLRCEAISLPSGAPRGIVTVTYGGYPLGFVKNIGNRANNLYPKSWRILSQNRSQNR